MAIISGHPRVFDGGFGHNDRLHGGGVSVGVSVRVRVSVGVSVSVRVSVGVSVRVRVGVGVSRCVGVGVGECV